MKEERSGPTTRPTLGSDERGVIVSSMVKLLIGLAIAGLIVMEAAQILFARISIQDLADRAAAAGALAYDDSGSIREAHDAVTEVVSKDESARLRKFVVNPSDRTVRIILRKRASTLLVDEIGFLEQFSIAVGRATGEPPPV